jgi:hypothetical protein
VGRQRKPAFKPDLEVLEGRTLMSSTWIGNASTGNRNLWSNAANWSPVGVPGPGDLVIFDNNAQNSTSIVDIPRTIGTLNITWGGTINVNNTLTVSSGLNLAGGTFGGNGVMTINGSSSWTGGSLNGGSRGLTNMGTLTLMGNDKTLDGQLTNSTGARIIHQVGGRLYVNGESTIINQAGATYDFQGNGSYLSPTSGTATFINQGLVSKSSGDNSYLRVGVFTIDGGSFQVQAGTLGLAANTVTNTGASSQGFALAGAGTLDLTDANEYGGYECSYTGTYTGAADGGVVRLSGGTLAVGAGGATFNLPGLQWTGGTLQARGGLTNSGTLTLMGGDKFLDGQLTNSGTILHKVGGRLYVNAESTIINQAGATYDFQGDGSYLSPTSDNRTATFINQGLVSKSAGTNSYLRVGIFTIDGGSFQVQAGTLGLAANTVTNTGASAFALAGAGTLDLTDANEYGGYQCSYTGTYTGAADGGVVRLSGGTLAVGAGGATFNLPGLQWTGGTLRARGGLTNSGTLTLMVGDKTLDGQLTNSGTILHKVGGRLYVNDESTIINQAGATYDFQGDGSYLSPSSGNSTATFINQGLVSKSAGANSYLRVGIFTIDGGSFQVQAGTLGLAASTITNTGASPFALAGAGTLDLTDANEYGGYECSYTGTYTGAADGGVVRLSGGTLAVGAGGATFNLPGLQWTGGTLQARGGLTNSGTLTLMGNDKALDGQLTNSGTILHKAGGTLYVNAEGTITNQAGATYDFREDGAAMAASGSNRTSIFNNLGTVLKSQGNGTATLSLGVFNNTSPGKVDVQNGTLNLSVQGTSTSTGTFNAAVSTATVNFTGGAFTLNSGAAFTGIGLVQVNGATLIVNATVGARKFTLANGTLKLLTTGILNVDGDYTQGGSGTLSIDISGTTAGNGFGQLNVTGTASLGGALNIRLVNAYTPGLGATFKILTYASRGTPTMTDFGTKNGLGVGNGTHFTPVYNDATPGDLTLKVDPD